MKTRVVKEADSVTAVVRTRCDHCGTWNSFDADEPLPGILCGKCEKEIPLSISQRLVEGDSLDRCCRCGADQKGDFWVRKDFDPKLGVGIVAVAAVLAFWTYGLSLLLATVIDVALYACLPMITTCYRCRSEYRGMPVDPDHGGFDLAHQEDLEQEQATEARRRRGDAEPADGPVL